MKDVSLHPTACQLHRLNMCLLEPYSMNKNLHFESSSFQLDPSCSLTRLLVLSRRVKEHLNKQCVEVLKGILDVAFYPFKPTVEP